MKTLALGTHRLRLLDDHIPSIREEDHPRIAALNHRLQTLEDVVCCRSNVDAESLLQEQSKDAIEIVGAFANACIPKVVVEAVYRGYEVHVPNKFIFGTALDDKTLPENVEKYATHLYPNLRIEHAAQAEGINIFSPVMGI